MTEDSKELASILASNEVSYSSCKASSIPFDEDCMESPRPSKSGYNLNSCCQWSTSDDKRFVPTSRTQSNLTPGVYDICFSNNVGIYFEKIPVLATDLIRFPETNSEKVVEEIQKFWEKEDIFKEYKLTYKRGIILWGPPGSGKSSTIQIIMKDVVERDGIVIRFGNPSIFTDGMRRFKEIQPDTPVVVLMEDIDSTLNMYSETEVLNILDGVNQIDKVVYLATTNYPERLGARIINRPSRFDKRFKIGHPNEESRKMYLEHLIGKDKINNLKIDIDKWVEDTEDFSLAHIKELFTAVVILGDNYEESVETLSEMREASPTSNEDEVRKPIGFVSEASRKRKRI